MQEPFSLYQVFRETVVAQPDHPAIIGRGEDQLMSYRELGGRVDAVSSRLEAHNVGRGMCIGMHIESGLDYILFAYAIWKCGASIVPIAVELVAEEKSRICREIGISAIVTKRDSLMIFEPFLKGKSKEISDDFIYVPVEQSRKHPPGLSGINTAFIRFTSGTTGTSKGIVLSHETIYERIQAANDGLHIGSQDRVVWLLSMSYHFAVSIVAYLSFGASIILCRNFFGTTIVKTSAKYRATLIYGSPVHYHFMASAPGSQMLPDLRLAISTTNKMKKETAEAFFRRFNLAPSEAYGIIEVGLPFINLEKVREKTGSVGKALPSYEIELADCGFGEDMPEIKLRGKGFIDAYYEPWRLREDIMQDGWFHTGDLGQLDEDEYLYIVGRSKEIINVGGMKFFPQEVEKVLESHPAIKEACVYSVSHPRLGETPHANVVAEPGVDGPPAEEDLRDYCAKCLETLKIPEKILFIDKLERTASGKLIRQKVSLTC
ncbi:MAG: acyl--CoA ligase [Gammaproteobacteria bacterium]|nr:acyl--CoA ligase [Gammaproteobacteria bacterium]